MVGLDTKGSDDRRKEGCLHVTYSFIRTAYHRVYIPENLRTHEDKQRVDVVRIVVHLSFVVLEHHILDPGPAFEIRFRKLLFSTRRLVVHAKSVILDEPIRTYRRWWVALRLAMTRSKLWWHRRGRVCVKGQLCYIASLCQYMLVRVVRRRTSPIFTGSHTRPKALSAHVLGMW